MNLTIIPQIFLGLAAAAWLLAGFAYGVAWIFWGVEALFHILIG